MSIIFQINDTSYRFICYIIKRLTLTMTTWTQYSKLCIMLHRHVHYLLDFICQFIQRIFLIYKQNFIPSKVVVAIYFAAVSFYLRTHSTPRFFLILLNGNFWNIYFLRIIAPYEIIKSPHWQNHHHQNTTGCKTENVFFHYCYHHRHYHIFKWWLKIIHKAC